VATVGIVEVGINVDARAARSELNRTSKDFDRVGREAELAARRISGFQKGLLAVGAAVGAAGYGLVKYARQSFMAAADVSEMNVAMDAVNKSLGLVPDAIRNASMAVRDMGIEMKSSQEIALIFAQGNLDLAKAAKVARVAQDLAVLSQSNSTATARLLAYAIQTGNSMLLKSAGITKYAGEAYQDYAKQLGKTEAGLTASERQQAVMNMILEEGEKVAGTYEAAMMEAGKVLRSFPRIFNELQVAFGSILQNGFGPAIKAAYDATKAFTALFQEGGALRPVIDQMQVAFKDFLQPLTDFLKGLKDNLKTFNRTKVEIGELTDSFKKFFPAVAAAATAISTFAGTQLLKTLPIIGNYAGAIGGAVPAALAVFIASNEDARAAFLNLIEAVRPAIEATISLTESLATIMIPVINSFATFARIITENEAVLKTLLITLAAVKVANLALGSSAAVAAAGVVKNFRYMYGAVQSANATFGASTSAVRVFGQTAIMSFKAAAVAAKAFIASVLPLLALTAAIYAAVKAFEMFTAESKARKETTEAFTKALIENTQALLENNEAGASQADLQQLLRDSMLSSEDVAQKLTGSFGALGKSFDETQFMAMQSAEGFQEEVSAMLEARGVSDEYTQAILDNVAAYDSNAAAAVHAKNEIYRIAKAQGMSREEAKAYALSLEDEIRAVAELRDQTENFALTLEEFNKQKSELVGLGLVADRFFELAEATVSAEEGFSKLNEEQQLAAILLKAIELQSEDTAEAFKRMQEALAVAESWSDYADPAPFQASTAAIEELNNKLKEQQVGAWDLATQMDTTNMSIDDFRHRIELLDKAVGLSEASIYQLAQVFDGLETAVISAERALFNMDKTSATFAKSIENLESESTDLRDVAYQLYDEFHRVGLEMLSLGNGIHETQAAQVALINTFLEAADAAGFQRDQVMKLIEELGILDSLSPHIAVTIGLNLEQVRAQIRELVGAFGTAFSGGAGMLGMAEELAALERLEEALARIESHKPYVGGRGGGGGGGDTWEDFRASIAEFANFLNSAGFAEALFYGTSEDIVNALRGTLDNAASLGMLDGGLADPFRPVFEKFAADMVELAEITTDRDKLMGQLIQGKELAQWSKSLFGIGYDPSRGFRGSARLALRQARNFKQNLTALKDKGFPPSVIAQVLSAGLVGGTAMARELLGMSRADKAELLSAQAEIESIAKDVGGKGGLVESLFGVPKLESEIATLDTTIASLITTIQTDLNGAFRDFLSRFEGGIEKLSTSGTPAFPANPTSININLTAETGADTQRIGAEIVDILNQYFRNGGAPLISTAVAGT